MPTKIRNVELLTLARSDAGTPVLGHVGVGIDANLIQDFEMGLSRVGSAAQFNLALNVEGATTNTAHYGGIAFTQGASADTIMASIKAVNTSVDGYVDLSFNTRSVSNALVIKADGKVGIGTETDTVSSLLHIKQSSGGDSIMLDIESNNDGGIRFGRSGHGSLIYHRTTAKDFMGFVCNGSAQPTAPSDAQLPMMVINEDGKVGIGTGSTAPQSLLHIGTRGTASALTYGADDGIVFDFYNDGNPYARHASIISNGDLAASDLSFWVSPAGSGVSKALLIESNSDAVFFGNVGIGTGSAGPSYALEVNSGATNEIARFASTDDDGLISVGDDNDMTYIGYDHSNTAMSLGFDNGMGATNLTIKPDGKIGIGTGSTTLTELLEVNGNAKATKFIGALEGNADTVTTNANLTGDVTSVGNATSIAAGVIINADVKSDAAIAYSKLGAIPTWNQNTTGNASTATALETARNIVVGKSVAGAGDIDAITQSFNGGANISFDSTLNSHLPADLRGTTSDNIADEPSNNAVKIIGSDINTPRLKINRQGLIVGFEEVATSGGGGSGGISALTLTTNGLLYLNAGLTTQTETTSTSTPTLNLYLKSAGLFTALTESGGTMSVTVGGTTKTLALPNASFTQFQRISSTQLQATVGTTQLTADLSGASVANATNATNAANVAIAANATDSARYLTFVTGSSGNLPLLMDTGITYNPSSNTLATTNFVGALSGNATTSSGLLIGSTTYLPSTSATSTNNLVARNASSQVHIKELVLSDNTTSSSLSMFIGKISGSDILHEFSGGQALALLGINTIFTGNGPYAISITGNAATATTAAACSGNAATATTATNANNINISTQSGSSSYRLVFTRADDNAGLGPLYKDNSAGLYYNPSTNRLTTTTFAGALVGNASSATGLVWSGATRSPSSAATANTIAVRGSGGALTIAGLTCTTVGATTMSAQSLELTNQGTGTNFSLKAHNIVPRGTITSRAPYLLTVNYVANSSIGDFSNPSVGAFDRIDANYLYGTSILQFSDRRLKENISPFELGLDFVRLLEPKSYNKIGSKTPRKYYGAIAQEVAEVMKEIGIEDESMVSIRGHHEKTEEEREQAVKTYDPQQIMWVLFNAVKQLDAEVQDLKKELKK